MVNSKIIGGIIIIIVIVIIAFVSSEFDINNNETISHTDDSVVEITDSAVLYSHPQTSSVSAYDMQTLEIIEKDGEVLSEPVLLYASDSRNDELKFRVTAPNGQCIIGSSDECSVQDSTRGNRGGLQSVQFNDQTLRIKYSGSDSMIERFSITSIDPIVGDWSITLESEEGFIPQAQAVKDLDVKIKHKIHSEINTVYSD